MKKAIIFLALTAAIAVTLGGLFAVIVCAPEPWQSRPWTPWEHCAGWLLAVFGWPITLGMMLFDRIGGRNIPEALVTPFFISLFIISGAFWAAAFFFVVTTLKRKKSPNQQVEASVASAPQPHL